MRVTPFGIPIPFTLPLLGSSTSTLKEGGERKHTTLPLLRGRSSTPLARGRMLPSAMKQTSPSSSNLPRRMSWSSADLMWLYSSSQEMREKIRQFYQERYKQ